MYIAEFGGFLFFSWLVSIVFALVIASNKNRNVAAWFIFALFCGPLPLFILPFLDKIEERKLTEGDQAGFSLREIRDDFKKAKEQLFSLQETLTALGKRIDKLENAESQEPQAYEEEVFPEKKEIPAKTVTTDAKGIDREFDFGRKWLNKIGITIFAIGTAFLITYSFQHFGPIYKIIVGYLIGAGLFFSGLHFEKIAKLKNYGRVFLGGAGAIIYFTTYAMHHFQASRIMESQLLNLILLAGVALGVILYSLKYNSQILAAIAIGLGYITSTLGNINYFTLISLLLLAVAVLILVYKNRWVNLIFFGIILTYFVHFFWVFKHIYVSPLPIEDLSIAGIQEFINLGFLFVYWFVFLLGIHLFCRRPDRSLANKLSVANFFNFILFFISAYPNVDTNYPGSKFAFVFGLGLVYLLIAFLMFSLRNKKIYTNNALIALSLLTLAIPLKFLSYHVNIIWLVEVPFLLTIGLIFKSKLFRYFSYWLSIFILGKFIFVDFGLRHQVYFFGTQFSWMQIVSLIGVVAMFSCFFLIYFKERKIFSKELLANIFSPLAVSYLALFSWETFSFYFLPLALVGQAIILFLLSWRLQNSVLRRCTFFIYFGAALYFLAHSNYSALSFIRSSLVIFSTLSGFYIFYAIYRYFLKRALGKDQDLSLSNFIYSIAILLTLVAIYRNIGSAWISLSFGVVGSICFILGFLLKDRVFRLGGFVIFGVTLLQIIFVDIAGLSTLNKMISFIVLGLLFLAISFIYTKYYPSEKSRVSKK